MQPDPPHRRPSAATGTRPLVRGGGVAAAPVEFQGHRGTVARGRGTPTQPLAQHSQVAVSRRSRTPRIQLFGSKSIALVGHENSAFRLGSSFGGRAATAHYTEAHLANDRHLVGVGTSRGSVRQAASASKPDAGDGFPAQPPPQQALKEVRR